MGLTSQLVCALLWFVHRGMWGCAWILTLTIFRARLEIEAKGAAENRRRTLVHRFREEMESLQARAQRCCAPAWSGHLRGRKQGGLNSAPTNTKSRAKEDGFALEQIDGDEIPVIGAGDEFLAEKADVEDRDERKFGGELRTGKHGRKSGNDNYKRHRREIALGFLVSFGEEGDGHQNGGEKKGNGEGHEENGDDRLGTELEEKTCGSCASPGSQPSVVT